MAGNEIGRAMMEFLSEENLHKLNTKRLLGLYKSLREAVRWNGHWDASYMDKVIAYRNLVKEILNTREHVK